MVVKKTKHQYVRNEKEHSSAQEVYSEKGTRYISVDVDNVYLFTFSRTGKTLMAIEDLHLGEWITYEGKETKIWLNYPGARRIYEGSVLPTLKMFLKKYPK